MKQTGKIKWFSTKKGYGFITPENGLKDIFIHRSALEVAGINDLNDNQKIEFEVAIDKGKEAATNIKLIN